MAISVQKRDEQLWSGVLELTKLAQEKNGDPLLWAVQVSSRLNSSGELLPSPELAHVLVSHICWDNHVPVTWKFLEKALALNIAPALLVLALLSSRVVPNRQIHPSAYRLFLELLKKYAFRLSFQINGPDYHKILKSIDDVLHLSQISGLQACESGLRLVEFVFSTVVRLLDASIEDEGLMELATEGRSTWSIGSQNMEIDGQDCFDENRNENNEVLHKVNVTLAIEIIGKFLQNRKTSRLLYLASQSMPLHWADFIQRLRLLAADSASFRNLKTINLENLLHLTYDTSKVLSLDGKRMKQKGFHAAMSSGLLFSHVASRSEVWLPIDMLLEDAVNGVQVVATGALQRLTCLVKSLQAVNDTSWHNTFLGLWIASLRLVQRERDPSEGPVPRLDTCLCMLLSITTLVVTNIIEEEEGELMEEAERMPINQRKEKGSHGRRRGDLVTSLQQLGDYKGLLTPPQSINSVANQAALKAMMFVSGMAVGDGHYDCVNVNDVSLNCSGNLRHLIVEACIARNLLDTSAYFWPGYVNASSNQLPCNVTGQVAGWSSLVKGAPLTPAMVNALVATPASSLAEIEKIYEIAINGSDDEKISAVTILCGASLVCGWNVQEHIALFITRFLSPPAPADYTGTESYLISCAPFLNVLLLGISSVDCVHIFSLHGLVPLLAGQLMPICEAFGSTASNASQTSTTGEVLASHAVFSNAFTLLLRLWRFDHPPLDHLNGDGPPVGSQRSPEYLLLVRNSMLASFGSSPKDRLKARRMSKLLSFPLEPIFMDHFPKLKRWYRQHQECIASILSSLVPGTPVHQMVDALLSMMFRKIKKDGQPSTPTTSGSSNSSGSVITDETFGNLKVPAWDILEAIPFVLDAALTAIAHGRLSPRELATGLKDLADFLPASLAPIVSYLSAEVTRGIWKPAFMNGTDWPSPAANLLSVEQQIKKILAATGVNVPSLPAGGSSPATLPLPLAALVSFTITYKLDKASERFLTVVGPALSALAVGCPWPSMPILTSLWTKKVKRWSDFLIFSASRTVFHHNNYAVVQLLKSCFTSALGLNTSLISSDGGVGDLLGHGFGSHFSGGISPVAPGILYLRVHPAVKNPFFLADEIVSLLILSVGDISTSGLPPKEREDRPNASKSGATSSYRQVSLGKAMTRVKLAASLGASLVWLSGGFSLVQSLIKETLPSWFISVHSEKDSVGDFAGMVAMLRGYALAYFAMLSGAFAWGVDSGSAASKRRAYILSAHLEFVASALEGKISLGCNQATWKSYVSGFISLLVVCMPTWVREVNVDVLNRLSNELWRINEEDLALALLGRDGIRSVDVATQLILSGS